MWESPIKILQTQIETELEGEVLKAVCKYGIDVNRDRLLEILQNDRSSYDEGYAEGKREVCERILEKLEEEAESFSPSEKDCVFAIMQDKLLEIVKDEIC